MVEKTCNLPTSCPYGSKFVIQHSMSCKKGGFIYIRHNKLRDLKGQSCKLNNNKYMITSTQITNTEIFAFITVLVFKLLNRKVLFINRKDNRTC